MINQMNVKTAERKAWRSVFQDGLWDIYLGLLLLAMGIGDLLDNYNLSTGQYYSIYFGVIIFAMAVLWAGKHFITLPRLGRVKFGKKGKTRQNKTRLLLFGSVAFGLIAWFLADAGISGKLSEQLWDVIFPLAYVVNMLLVFGLGAYFLDYPRLYIVAVMFALPIPLKILLRRMIGTSGGYLTFMVPALIIVGMGIYCLLKFIRTYPVLSPSEKVA
jgi:hypothetical protein